MNSIKFRVWDYENKRFGYINIDPGKISWPHPSYLKSCVDVDPQNLVVFPTIGDSWQQFTGLKDKNGQEGYHKDIVRMAIFLYTIEWCDKSAKFYLKSINGIDNTKYTMTKFTKHGYIEGNIFENPELLEKK